MKKLLIASGALLLSSVGFAQQKEGKVIYERTSQMQVRIAGIGGDDVQQMLPRQRTDKMEVMFGNNQSLRRAIVDEMPEEEQQGGLQIRTINAGADDISFSDFSTGLITDQRDFAGKKYLVADSIRKLNWKLTGETKTILNYPCQQAVTQRVGQRMTMSVENGQVKSQSVPDTSNIDVWFTGAVPVSAGPDFQGQLPGLILEININNGNIVYKALEVLSKVDLSAVKEPRSGKKVTQNEFNKEREKAIEEMQRNSNGRGRSFRIGG